MVLMGRGFTSGGQESGCAFGAAVHKIQARKRYIQSLPLVLKDERSWFSRGERSTVQLPLDHVFVPTPLGSRVLNCIRKPSIQRLRTRQLTTLAKEERAQPSTSLGLVSTTSQVLLKRHQSTLKRKRP